MVSNGTTLPAGAPTRVVFGSADRAIDIAMSLPKPNDLFEVVCHGDRFTDGYGCVRAGAMPKSSAQARGQYATAAELAVFIQDQPGFVGQTVQLLMCYVGIDLDYLGEVADMLGVHVIAATRILEADPVSGEFHLHDVDGRWVEVYPRRKIDVARALARMQLA